MTNFLIERREISITSVEPGIPQERDKNLNQLDYNRIWEN